jgi:hypothetical protein
LEGVTRVTRRILFLDDDPARHRKFQMEHIGCDVTYVMTYEGCVEALETQDAFDEAHLDHDLSEQAAAGCPAAGEKTGTDVAAFIASLGPEKWPDMIIIHSFNDEGRRRMRRILRESGHQHVMLFKFGGAR